MINIVRQCQTVAEQVSIMIQQYYFVNDKHVQLHKFITDMSKKFFFKNIIYQSKIFLGSTLFTPLVTVRHFT